MKLYLMRHGEACNPEQDPERGLTSKGKQDIQKVASSLKDNHVSFHKVLHSPKKRARETAEIMMQTLAPSASISVFENIQPNDDPQFLENEIYSWDDDTLITSHLPYVPNLITALTTRDAYLTPITFETGTLVCLEKDEASAGWHLAWHTAPSEIV